MSTSSVKRLNQRFRALSMGASGNTRSSTLHRSRGSAIGHTTQAKNAMIMQPQTMKTTTLISHVNPVISRNAAGKYSTLRSRAGQRPDLEDVTDKEKRATVASTHNWGGLSDAFD